MKNFTAMAAAGTLAVLAIPAQAAEITQPVTSNMTSSITSNALPQSTFAPALNGFEETAQRSRKKRHKKARQGRYNNRYDST